MDWNTKDNHSDIEGHSFHKTDPWMKSGLKARSPPLAKMAGKIPIRNYRMLVSQDLS